MSAQLEELLDRLEAALAQADALDEDARELVFGLLADVDALHRFALRQLGDAAGPETLARLRDAHPAVDWLLDAYAVGVDERAVADAALEAVRPYVSSHGGHVEVVSAADGVVRVRMSGSCSGCTGADATLSQGVEEALREGFPGFLALEVEQDDAPAHPPPTPALVQIGPRPAGM